MTVAVRGTDATYAAGDRVGVVVDTSRAIYEPVGPKQGTTDVSTVQPPSVPARE